MKNILILLSIFMVVGAHLYHEPDDMKVQSTMADHLVEEVEIASEAYIYSISILETMLVLFHNNVWPHSSTYFPINAFKTLNQTFDWTTTANDPALEVLYSPACIDLKKHPIVLNIPDIPNTRYYAVTIADGYNSNIKIISPRTRGGSWAADQYVIVGPGFRGTLPSYFDDDHTLRSLSRFIFVLVRTQVFSPDDAPNVFAIENGFSFTSLDGSKPQENDLPVFPFLHRNLAVITEPGFVPIAEEAFSQANFMMNYMEIEDYESALFRRFAKIDFGPSKEFIGQKMSQQMYKNIQDGIANGIKIVDEVGTPEVVNCWENLYPSTHNKYLARAIISTLIGICANDPEEQLYRWARIDSDGDFLDSTKHDYTLTFSPGQFPHVAEQYGGFWSLAAYLGVRQGLLIDNPIDRYCIGGTTTPGLIYDDNGALTLYIQKTRPDSDAMVANWLPTPDPDFGGYETGEFHLHFRVYVPENVDYFPPAVVKAGPATL